MLVCVCYVTKREKERRVDRGYPPRVTQPHNHTSGGKLSLTSLVPVLYACSLVPPHFAHPHRRGLQACPRSRTPASRGELAPVALSRQSYKLAVSPPSRACWHIVGVAARVSWERVHPTSSTPTHPSSLTENPIRCSSPRSPTSCRRTPLCPRWYSHYGRRRILWFARRRTDRQASDVTLLAAAG